VVMMYVKYPLSLHNFEDALAKRGIDVDRRGVAVGLTAPPLYP
jgi:transposase-like protein